MTSKPVSRRAVIAGTVVALLLMAGGYVVAATLGGITPSQTSQNAGSISTPGNTIFATTGAVTANVILEEGMPSNCGDSEPWNTANYNDTVYMAGTEPCTNGQLEWFEELTWLNVPVPGYGQLDTFFITIGSSAPTTYNYVAFTITDQTTGDHPFTGELNVWMAEGSATLGALPTGYTSISIAVSGT